MSVNNHIERFSALDIEKYHKGLLTAAERHGMEKAALEDPFLADAIEGYTTAGVNVAADMAELNKRLLHQTTDRKVIPITTSTTNKPIAWLRVAAAVLIIGGAAVLANQFIFNKRAEKTIVDLTPIQKKNDTTIDTNATIKNTTNEDVKATDATNTGNNKEKNTTGTPTTNKQDGMEAANMPAIVTTSDEEKFITKNKAASDENKVALSKLEMQSEREVKEIAVLKDAPIDNATQNKSQAPATPVKKMEAEAAIHQSTTRLFKGRITDNSNNGLPFAKVYNPADNNAGTYTDAHGNFTLTYPDTVLQVQVKALGFETVSTRLHTNASTNRIILPDDRSLTDMVISNQRVNTNRRAVNNNYNNRQLIEPEPSDGWANYDAYIANNLQVPDELGLIEKRNSGYVQISFEVDKNGEPINIAIDKSLCPSCDKEAIRLVKDGPKWKRTANKQGRTTVTINF
jgi:hypothetical protein